MSQGRAEWALGETRLRWETEGTEKVMSVDEEERGKRKSTGRYRSWDFKKRVSVKKKNDGWGEEKER